MSNSPAPETPLQTAIRRRKWLWIGAGLGGAGLLGFGAAATRPRWRPRSAAAVDIETEVCVISPPSAYDPASGLPADAPRPVPADARCPVCGMYPARYPLWAGQVLYRDHAAHFFDSPVDLMQFLADVQRYAAGHGAADVQSRWITDAASGAWVALEQAWFVLGSDELGPMRRGDLPAFAGQAGAASFARQHGGQALAFGAVTPAIVKSLAIERGHGLQEHAHGA
ncbi:MAG: nitrous oxide reductase accessory protein NosL [Desulfovibrionaceae bacterium]|jgi:nitrous oxide reductase accessory protein NosL|nr:nitrous oxide reductase accessory protein NosL [Desulfovibrionaceae bacterium]